MIEETLEMWRYAFPEEVLDFEADLQGEKDDLARSNGMSHDGDCMAMRLYPYRPYVIILKILPGFWERKDAGRVWDRVYGRTRLKRD